MSMPFNVINEDFRDFARRNPYPFQSDGALMLGRTAIPTGLFLDCVIYSDGDYKLPFYLTEMVGLTNLTGMILTFSDANGKVVGTAPVTAGTGDSWSMVTSPSGLIAGSVTYSAEAAASFVGLVRNTPATGKLPLLLSCCYAYELDEVTSFSNSLSSAVTVTASEGVSFRSSNIGGTDVVVDLTGPQEPPEEIKGIRSINTASVPDILLIHDHPSDVRVATSGSEIKLTAVRDADNG